MPVMLLSAAVFIDCVAAGSAPLRPHIIFVMADVRHCRSLPEHPYAMDGHVPIVADL